MHEIFYRLEQTALELLDEGHELSSVNLGIWDGPRRYTLTFFSRGKAVEEIPVFLATAADFDRVRTRAAQLLGDVFIPQQATAAG